MNVGLPLLTLNEQVADGGQPLCDKETLWEFPLSKLAVTAVCVLLAWATVASVGLVLTEKSNGV